MLLGQKRMRPTTSKAANSKNVGPYKSVDPEDGVFVAVYVSQFTTPRREQNARYMAEDAGPKVNNDRANATTLRTWSSAKVQQPRAVTKELSCRTRRPAFRPKRLAASTQVKCPGCRGPDVVRETAMLERSGWRCTSLN